LRVNFLDETTYDEIALKLTAETEEVDHKINQLRNIGHLLEISE
jgi:hypothetical protein